MIPDWESERRRMVEEQLRNRGIGTERVLNTINAIPREEFVPPEARLMAYSDEPIHIGCGQTISQPYMTALMAESLELAGTEKVLEVGAGCGYHAAVLGNLAARVISVEIIPALAELARRNLARAGLDHNVTVVCGDGSLGHPDLAPYDAISVEAAAPEIPPALLDQLNDPGRLVIPVGERGEHELLVVWKRRGRIEHRVATLCRFVPLRFSRR